MYSYAEVEEYKKDYQLFRARIAYIGRLLMEVNGYRQGDLTKSPLDYYVATWPGVGISPSIITTMRSLQYEMAAHVNFPINELRYAMYATAENQEYNYPILDNQTISPLIPNIISQKTDFLRIDGIFFSISIHQPQRAANILPIFGFCSFFNLPQVVYNMYKISGRDEAIIHINEARSEIIDDIGSIVEKFPSWSDINSYIGAIYEQLQQR